MVIKKKEGGRRSFFSCFSSFIQQFILSVPFSSHSSPHFLFYFTITLVPPFFLRYNPSFPILDSLSHLLCLSFPQSPSHTSPSSLLLISTPPSPPFSLSLRANLEKFHVLLLLPCAHESWTRPRQQLPATITVQTSYDYRTSITITLFLIVTLPTQL